MTKKDYKAILGLAEKLKATDDKTGWFTEEARKKLIPLDLNLQQGYVAEEDKKIIGFITYFSDDGHAQIGWLGVDPELHGRGTGTALMKKLEQTLRKMGFTELLVETAAKEQSIGTSYESTHKFYSDMGFKRYRIKKKEDTGYRCDMDVLKKAIE